MTSRQTVESSSRLSANQQQRNQSNSTRVLIVDDHALVRAGIRELISRIEGMTVISEAGRGDEALALIEESKPDLVLLDITMPGMSGFEVLQEISKRFPDVRVVILTMHEAREYAIQSLRGGAAGFIPKSAASAELKKAIQTVMRGKTYVSSETPQEFTSPAALKRTTAGRAYPPLRLRSCHLGSCGLSMNIRVESKRQHQKHRRSRERGNP